MDANQVNAQLWTGAAITSEDDVVQMVVDGITTDIDCRLEYNDQTLITEYENAPPSPPSLRTNPLIAYYYAGVADDGQPKSVDWFQGVWEFAEPIFKAGGVVLSHCAAGVNRGPSMAYFLLRAFWGLSPDAAYALIKTARPQAEMGYRTDADLAITAMGFTNKE